MGSMAPYNSRKQITGRYGNPYLDPVHWPLKWIVKVILPNANGKPFTVWVNKDIAQQLVNVWNDLQLHGLLKYIHTYNGCYVLRPKRSNANQLSMHAWGLAIDINAKDNAMGTRGNMNPSVVQSFKKFGFSWGGDWHRPDPMHFEYSVAGL